MALAFNLRALLRMATLRFSISGFAADEKGLETPLYSWGSMSDSELLTISPLTALAVRSCSYGVLSLHAAKKALCDWLVLATSGSVKPDLGMPAKRTL